LHLCGIYTISGVPDRPPSAARRAYEHVKARLLDGTYRDGSLLSEGVVAQELDISRTPVREAFLQLEGEGLLELYPKRGALVVPVTMAEVADLFDARVALERHCLIKLADAPPPGLADELHAILARQREVHAAGDLVAFAAADRELHRAWVAATGNAVLLDLYDQLRDRQQRVTARMLARDGAARGGELLEEHERIVDALTNGDRYGAAAALERHLSAARAAADR
jgi:DNA-binding GntR family transcriptional regulator